MLEMNFFLTLELGRLCRTISVPFQNRQSDNYSHTSLTRRGVEVWKMAGFKHSILHSILHTTTSTASHLTTGCNTMDAFEERLPESELCYHYLYDSLHLSTLQDDSKFATPPSSVAGPHSHKRVQTTPHTTKAVWSIQTFKIIQCWEAHLRAWNGRVTPAFKAATFGGEINSFQWNLCNGSESLTETK